MRCDYWIQAAKVVVVQHVRRALFAVGCRTGTGQPEARASDWVDWHAESDVCEKRWG